MKDYSNAKIKIRDKECTRYQATQLMRQSETNMRYQQDKIITLKNAGMKYDKEEEKLKQMKKEYYYISKRAELKPRYDKAYVPGYKL